MMFIAMEKLMPFFKPKDHICIHINNYTYIVIVFRDKKALFVC